MKFRQTLIPTLFALSLTVSMFGGCKEDATTDKPATSSTDEKPGATPAATEHADPHDVPLTEEEIAKLKEDTATYQAAIEHIQSYRDVIKKETTGGEPAKAHRSLDLLDYVLQWLPEIAQSSNIPKDDWAAVGENAQKIRDLLNKVHENIDAGKAPEYETASDEIDAAVQVLAGLKPAPAE